MNAPTPTIREVLDAVLKADFRLENGDRYSVSMSDANAMVGNARRVLSCLSTPSDTAEAEAMIADSADRMLDDVAFWKRSFQSESRARIEAEARLCRLLLICRQIKWVGIGMPAAADGSTQQAFVQLAELLFSDGIATAIKRRADFPPSTCNAWEDCKHDGVCHDPEQCGLQEKRS